MKLNIKRDQKAQKGILWRRSDRISTRANKNLKEGADSRPTVDSFSVTPNSVTLGKSFTISYIVSDTRGSGLKRVELWRAIDIGGEPYWGTFLTDNPKQTTLLSAQSSFSSSFSDAPPSIAIYWYGIHVVNNVGIWSAEPKPPGPKKVTVTTHLSSPNPSSIPALSPSASPTTMRAIPTLSTTSLAPITLTYRDFNLNAVCTYANNYCQWADRPGKAVIYGSMIKSNIGVPAGARKMKVIISICCNGWGEGLDGPAASAAYIIVNDEKKLKK